MIDLGFDASGSLTSIVSTQTFWETYFHDGQYVTSTASGPGDYRVINDGGSQWFTTIDAPGPLGNVLTGDVGLLSVQRVDPIATPEASTWLMLALGFAAMFSFGKRRRLVRVEGSKK